jgi:hypothetical protein
MENSNFKETTICAEYTCAVSIDVDDICQSLGIKKEDIHKVNVNFNTMHLLMQNGDTLEYCLDNEMENAVESIDWKRPKSLYLPESTFNDLTCVDNPFKDTNN